LHRCCRQLDDRTRRAREWTDSLEDLVTTIVQTTVVLADHRLDTTMRRLAAWAAVIAVPTAISGFFGQNMPHPGFGQLLGLWESLLLTLLAAGGVHVVFERKGWLQESAALAPVTGRLRGTVPVPSRTTSPRARSR